MIPQENRWISLCLVAMSWEDWNEEEKQSKKCGFMEFTRTINKSILSGVSLFCILLLFSCNAQDRHADDEHNSNNPLIGKWKSVRLDKRGFQEFDLEKADLISQSLLIISEDSVAYSSIDFIDLCRFSRWKIEQYDTNEHMGFSLDFLYTKEELSKILLYRPVDQNGNFACYNDCSNFFLKGDTLINICGGYTFFLVRELNSSQIFSGSGNALKSFNIPNESKELNIEYDFYSAEDQVVIKDAEGNVLFNSNMKTTNGSAIKKISIDTLKKIFIEVKASSDTSKWKVKLSVY